MTDNLKPQQLKEAKAVPIEFKGVIIAADPIIDARGRAFPDSVAYAIGRAPYVTDGPFGLDLKTVRRALKKDTRVRGKLNNESLATLIANPPKDKSFVDIGIVDINIGHTGAHRPSTMHFLAGHAMYRSEPVMTGDMNRYGRFLEFSGPLGSHFVFTIDGGGEEVVIRPGDGMCIRADMSYIIESSNMGGIVTECMFVTEVGAEAARKAIGDLEKAKEDIISSFELAVRKGTLTQLQSGLDISSLRRRRLQNCLVSAIDDLIRAYPVTPPASEPVGPPPRRRKRKSRWDM